MSKLRTSEPRRRIRIEYENEDYIYISSRYTFKELKAEMLRIKKPIKIHFSASLPL